MERDPQFTKKCALTMMREGTVAVPNLFLKLYRKLKLSDMEAMIIIQLLSFYERDRNEFPTVSEIQSRMASSPDQMIKGLQRLVKEQYITIDDEIDPVSGIQYEKYNLLPLYVKMADAWLKEQLEQENRAGGAENIQSLPYRDLFSTFEAEFGRPLSPMECEMLSNWIDRDIYSGDLIVAALKEAVFAGKLHFRYIDRILLEWGRNQIRTPEEAKEFATRFRQQNLRRNLSQNSQNKKLTYPVYNWLEEE